MTEGGTAVKLVTHTQIQAATRDTLLLYDMTCHSVAGNIHADTGCYS